MVDENRVDGTIRNVAGKVQDAAGDVFGDSETQARGKANQFAGEAQANYGEALDTVRDFAADRPLTTVVSAVCAGVVLGFLLGRI